MKILCTLLAIMVVGLTSFSQESNETVNSIDFKSDQKESPHVEKARLEQKKSNILIRIDQLKTENGDQAEIERLEGLVRYIDRKIESLDKIILSVEYAEKTGAPVKGTMSDEEYEQKKLEWKDNQVQDDSENQIKTTLTRYEFEKLPKETQEKILSMPERYTIVE